MSHVSAVSFSRVAFGTQKPTMPKTRKVLQALFPPNPTDHIKRGLAGAAIAATTLYIGQSADNVEILSTGIVLASWAKLDAMLGVFRSIVQNLTS